MGVAVGVGGILLVAPQAQKLNNAPPSTYKASILGQSVFDMSTTPPTEYVWNGQTWVAGAGTGGAATFASVTTTGAIVAGTTVTAGTGITSTTGNIVATAGQVNAGTSMTAGTSITATLGNITATNGNFVKGTAGNKDVYTSVATTTAAGANSAGTVTLVGGTATVSTTAVTASSKIRLDRQGVGATGANPLGILSVGTISAGTSFVINAVQVASATSLQASDVSSIWWEIVN